MTSFLLSTDINEGGKFELTVLISGKVEKGRKIHQYYNIEFLGNRFEKLLEVNAVARSLRKRKLKLRVKMNVMKNVDQKYLVILWAKQNRTLFSVMTDERRIMLEKYKIEKKNVVFLYLFQTP